MKRFHLSAGTWLLHSTPFSSVTSPVRFATTWRQLPIAVLLLFYRELVNFFAPVMLSNFLLDHLRESATGVTAQRTCLRPCPSKVAVETQPTFAPFSHSTHDLAWLLALFLLVLLFVHPLLPLIMFPFGACSCEIVLTTSSHGCLQVEMHGHNTRKRLTKQDNCTLMWDEIRCWQTPPPPEMRAAFLRELQQKDMVPSTPWHLALPMSQRKKTSRNRSNVPEPSVGVRGCVLAKCRNHCALGALVCVLPRHCGECHSGDPATSTRPVFQQSLAQGRFWPFRKYLHVSRASETVALFPLGSAEAFDSLQATLTTSPQRSLSSAVMTTVASSPYSSYPFTAAALSRVSLCFFECLKLFL